MSLILNGTNQYIYAATNSAYSFGSGDKIGIEVWFYPTSAVAFDTLFCRADGSTNDSTWMVRVDSAASNKLEFVFWNGSQNHIYTTTDTFTLNAWNHLALYYTYGTGSSMQVYINFALASGSWTSNNGNSSPSANSLRATIGNRGGNGTDLSNYFKGTMMEVRLFKNLTVPADAAAVRARAYKKIDAATTGMIGYWRLDEGTGTTSRDLSATANNGTLVNTPTWSTSVPSGWDAFQGGII